MKSFMKLAYALSVVVLILSCGKDDNTVIPPIDTTQVVIDYGPAPNWMDTIIVDTSRVSETPMGDLEAEWIALWWSRDLVAPAYLYERVLRDLKMIREGFVDLDPPLKGRFDRSWNPGYLGVIMSDSAITQYLEGAYTDLEELNQLFRLDHIVDSKLEDWGLLHLYFETRAHPLRFAKFYLNISSVVDIYLNYTVRIGSELYPWYANGKLTYLFEEVWDCTLSGCLRCRYRYFRTTDFGDVEFLGTYDPKVDSEPCWWPEADRNRDAYYNDWKDSVDTP
jgi:hypothetical protein